MDVVDFFSALGAPMSALSEKAAKARDNISKWPSHIPKGPLFELASALIDEPIPPLERGFKPFSIRKCLKGEMVTRFGMDELVMVLPKYGDGAQAGVTAKMIKENAVGKLSVYWAEEQSRPATKEEVTQFMNEAFGV